MKAYRLATLCASIFSILGLLGPVSCAQSSPKVVVVQPSPETGASGQQELELKGLKTSSDAIGVRVFLDPPPDTKLDANSKSYLGSVYFSHQKDANSKNKEGNFVLPIRKKVTGPIRVVIYPISATGSSVSSAVEVREARIKPADNSAFQ
jgi:hypothetical protein